MHPTMSRLYLVPFFWLLFAFTAQAQSYRVDNANVWTGEGFARRTVHVVHGRFAEAGPAWVDSVIDARGKYLVPPFGDYHTHNFDIPTMVEAIDSAFRAQGIFYAQDLANDPIARAENSAYLQQSHTVDVASANGLLTSDYGHPIEGYERMALGIGWPRNDEQRRRVRESRLREGRTYHIVDSLQDVEPAMLRLMASQPDIVKVVLYHSEGYAAGERIEENKGLRPQVLDSIQRIAARYERPIIAHIESIADLRTALGKGIRAFAHAPLYAYGNDGRISPDYPRLPDDAFADAAGEEVIVNPTLLRTLANVRYLPEDRRPDESGLEIIKDFHRDLLRSLDQQGVRLVLGADSPRQTAMDEVLYYHDLGVFSNERLLQMLIDSGVAIFPNRRIGKIAAGYEASFLLLAENPLENFEAVQVLDAAMKQGKWQ